jgi:hypothetical protein
MQPVARAMKDAGKRNHLFVCSSTTTPGAIDAALVPMLERELGGICGRDFDVCYNPEFIALGDVINGLLEPDLVLIGESDPQSGAALEQLYIRNSPRIACMSIVSAELTKISLNSYITMKISFTNAADCRAPSTGRYPCHARRSRQRQPHWKKIPARRFELWTLVHDFAATPANAPSLHEFELISNWEKFKNNPGVKLAVICCPWPQYRDLAPAARTRVFTQWRL